MLVDAPRPGATPRLDVVGATLSALGLGLIVLGVLQGSNWGFVRPKNSPVEPFGFSLTPFMVVGGGVVLWLFVQWQHHREARGRDPLVHLSLFRVRPLRAGLQAFLSQNLILMGIFFTIPLYLQLVLGFDALETGIRMLPVSVAMFITSAAGSWLARRFFVRSIIRAGLLVSAVSALGLVATVDPQLKGIAFGIAMALLGVGMGLIASQLGNVVQSSVDASGRSEAGGLQYTAQQLGSALGVALIGAIVLTGLVNTFVHDVSSDPRISKETADAVSTEVNKGVSFVSSDVVQHSAEQADLPPDEVDALVDHYEDSQIEALKAGLLVAAVIALGSLAFTKGLPDRAGETERDPEAVPA
jgi:Na+/melibiose symporter-like transporter